MVFNLKLNANESLPAYAKIFETARDGLVSHLGEGSPINSHKCVEKMPGYNSNKPQEAKLQDKVFGRLMALMFLGNRVKEKYESLMIGSTAQFSLKNDQYPKTVTKAKYVLSNHHLDNEGKKKA